MALYSFEPVLLTSFLSNSVGTDILLSLDLLSEDNRSLFLTLSDWAKSSSFFDFLMSFDLFAPFLAGGDSFLAGGDTFFLGDNFFAGGDNFSGDFFSKVMSCFSRSIFGGEIFFFLSFFEGWTGFEFSGFPFD